MSSTHLRTTTPAARKRYRCDWCNEPIEKGERHTAVTGVDDGFCTSRYHPECSAASQREIAAQGGFLDWTPGTFKRGSTEER